MRRRDWPTVVAVALIVILACAALTVGLIIYTDADRLQRSYEQSAAEKARDYTSRANVNRERRCLRLRSQAKQDCIREESEAARQGQHDEYDLQAQLVTSAWTRAMGIAAIIGMTFGIIGVGLVFITFRETRRAADASAKTYSAFTQLERARVIARTSNVYWNPPHIMAVKITLSNVGRSTATILTAHCDYMKGCDYPTEFEQTIRIDHTMASGSEFTFTIDAFDTETFRTHLFIGGFVHYRSAFGQDHRAYFLGRLDFVLGKQGRYGSETEDRWVVDSTALYCSRDEREAHFGWPADS